MSTAELKMNLHQLIDQIADETTLDKIYKMLSKAVNKEEDWYDTLSEGAKASIQRGLDDIKNGRVFSHEEATAKIADKISGFRNARK